MTGGVPIAGSLLDSEPNSAEFALNSVMTRAKLGGDMSSIAITSAWSMDVWIGVMMQRALSNQSKTLAKDAIKYLEGAAAMAESTGYAMFYAAWDPFSRCASSHGLTPRSSSSSQGNNTSALR